MDFPSKILEKGFLLQEDAGLLAFMGRPWLLRPTPDQGLLEGCHAQESPVVPCGSATKTESRAGADNVRVAHAEGFACCVLLRGVGIRRAP